MPSAPVVAVAAGAIVAAVIDIRTRRIPNLLTATMAIAGVMLAAMGVSGMSVAASLVGLAVGFALMMPGHLLGATGAGDVKLMAAMGAIVGPAIVISAFLYSAIAGGLLAIVIAIRRRRLSGTLAGTRRMIAAPSGARQEIQSATAASRFAYGPAIAVGSIVAVLVG